MVKKLKLSNKLICILLCTTLLLPLFGSITVQAEGDANEVARGMMNFFRGINNTLESGDITNDELRVFGVFASNFYIPFKTNYNTLLGISGGTAVGEEETTPTVGSSELKSAMLDIFFTGTGGNSSEAEQSMDVLLTLMAKGASQSKTPLYIKDGDSYVQFSLYYVFTKSISNDTVDIYSDSSGSRKVFSIGDDGYCDTALMMAMLANLDGAETYIKNSAEAFDPKSGSGAKAFDYQLYITAYGDIIDGTGTVIIPGCLNPYTFKTSSNGNLVLPINNSFYMGNMMQSASLVESSVTPKKDGSFSADSALRIPFYNWASSKSIQRSGTSVAIFGVDLFDRNIDTSMFYNIVNKSVNGGKNPADDLMNRIKTFKNDTINDTFIAIALDNDTRNKFIDKMTIPEADSPVLNFFTRNNEKKKRAYRNMTNGAALIPYSDVFADVGLIDTAIWRDSTKATGFMKNANLFEDSDKTGGFSNLHVPIVVQFVEELTKYIDTLSAREKAALKDIVKNQKEFHLDGDASDGTPHTVVGGNNPSMTQEEKGLLTSVLWGFSGNTEGKQAYNRAVQLVKQMQGVNGADPEKNNPNELYRDIGRGNYLVPRTIAYLLTGHVGGLRNLVCCSNSTNQCQWSGVLNGISVVKNTAELRKQFGYNAVRDLFQWGVGDNEGKLFDIIAQPEGTSESSTLTDTWFPSASILSTSDVRLLQFLQSGESAYTNGTGFNVPHSIVMNQKAFRDDITGGAITVSSTKYGTVADELRFYSNSTPPKYPSSLTGSIINQSYFFQVYTAIPKFANDMAMISSQTSGGQLIRIANQQNLWVGIYWAYLCRLLNVTEANGKYSVGRYSGVLPNLSVASLSSPDWADYLGTRGSAKTTEAELEAMKDDIIKRVYGLLSPTDNSYRTQLIKVTTNGWILDAHNSMIGSDGGTSLLGVGRSNNTYTGFTGHVTIPRMTELPFTKFIIDNYMVIYIILLLFTLLILITLTIVRYRTLRESIGIFLIMAVCLLLPNFLLDGAITTTNKVADSLYSDRFKFWAVVQHQQYLNDANAANSSTEELIIRNLQMAQEMGSKSSGVTLKWMAPKRYDMFDNIFSSDSSGGNLTTNLTIFRWLFSSYINQEFYTSNPLDTYLYRPYSDIVYVAKNYYDEVLLNDTDSSEYVSSLDELYSDFIVRGIPGVTGEQEASLNRRLNSAKSIEYLITAGGSGSSADMGFDSSLQSWTRSQIARAYMPEGGADGADNYTEHWAKVFSWSKLNEAIFNTTLNIDKDNMPGVELGFSSEEDEALQDKWGEFSLYSESVFYYFYNVLKLSGTRDPNIASSGEVSVGDSNFRDILLSETFYKITEVDTKNSDENLNLHAAYGKTRDYLDVYHLFNIVIPYMYAANDYVIDWTDRYGMDVSSISLEQYGWTDDSGISQEDIFKPDDEGNVSVYSDNALAKHEADALKKRIMRNIWSMYTPWVHQMNDATKFNDPVNWGGKRYKLTNPLLPSSYYEIGRPMVFGEADMIYKGLSNADLSGVETKIIQFLNDTYEDFQYLVNYIGFDDEVLICAAAMQATFNFNRIFSNSRILGESNILYPQGYELRNFNYDAFLRLILLNSTGEPLMQSQNLYSIILSKTSFFTGIILLVNDFISVYVLPVAKLLVVLLIFFLGLTLCVSCFLNKPEKLLKTLTDALLLPLLFFMLLALGHAFAISLMMGEGLTDLVGGKSVSVMTNDPTSTLLLLILINSLMIFFCIKLVTKILKSFKHYGVASALAVAGTVGVAGAALATKLKDGATGAVSWGSQRRRENRMHNETIDAIEGGGSESGGSDTGKGAGGKGKGAGAANSSNRGNSRESHGVALTSTINQGISGGRANIQNGSSGSGSGTGGNSTTSNQSSGRTSQGRNRTHNPDSRASNKPSGGKSQGVTDAVKGLAGTAASASVLAYGKKTPKSKAEAQDKLKRPRKSASEVVQGGINSYYDAKSRVSAGAKDAVKATKEGIGKAKTGVQNAWKNRKEIPGRMAKSISTNARKLGYKVQDGAVSGAKKVSTGAMTTMRKLNDNTVGRVRNLGRDTRDKFDNKVQSAKSGLSSIKQTRDIAKARYKDTMEAHKGGRSIKETNSLREKHGNNAMGSNETDAVRRAESEKVMRAKSVERNNNLRARSRKDADNAREVKRNEVKSNLDMRFVAVEDNIKEGRAKSEMVRNRTENVKENMVKRDNMKSARHQIKQDRAKSDVVRAALPQYQKTTRDPKKLARQQRMQDNPENSIAKANALRNRRNG